MKHYSNFTNQYVADICIALNEIELYKKLNELDEQYNQPFSIENLENLTQFIQRYVVGPRQIYYYLNEKGLVNRGYCPFTGERIDITSPYWTYMNDRSIYLSPNGLKMMQKEENEQFEKAFGKPNPMLESNQKTGGCYIATVCYGDEFAHQVITLQSYRDNVLSKTVFGRCFIRLYYTFSPFIANKLKNKNNLNQFIKKHFLDKIVEKIKNKKS